MNKLSWWQQEWAYFLNEALAFINASRRSDEPIDRCQKLCEALNKTWNAYFRHRQSDGKLNETERKNEAEGKRADNQSFQELLLHGMGDEQVSSLCESDSIRHFANFVPHIMNHNTLLRERYDPMNIAEEVRKKASAEHRQLINAFKRFAETPTDHSLKEALLKKTAQLIYVVRSNIAHSEKTPQGPDLGKAERDSQVSEVTARAIETIFDILFDSPSNRLAVYGSLAPGEANTSQFAGLDGLWQEGRVSGVVKTRDGFREFYWTLTAEPVPIKIYSAPNLKDRLKQLDRFEGPRYERIPVPVQIAGQTFVSNIYGGVKPRIRSN